MLSKPIPTWIVIGVVFLAGCAGCVNAAGLVGLQHQALSHMSGTAAIFGAEWAHGHEAAASHAALVLAAFFLGCLLSGLIVRQESLRLGRRYGVALVIESALLLFATRLLLRGFAAGDYFAAAACGLQNALATNYSGALIRTTHITGIVTDLGLAAGAALRGERIDRRRVGLYVLIGISFVAGSVLGGFGYLRIGYHILLVPAALTGSVGLAYATYRHFTLDQARG